MTRILTKNGVDNTNIDGARNYNFNAGRRSGIVKGALNQGNFFASSSNTIVLDSCELRLCGHRVVIDSAEYLTFYNKPSVPIRYSLVAQIIVDNNSDVSFDLHAQTSSTALVQDNLDINGSGTFELEIGRFTQLTDGTITDVVRTADLITGGADNDSDYIRIGTVTTNKISPELDADVDIENTINPTDNKPQTNFTFNLPTAVGTVVSVNGEEKTAINTDLTPTANSSNLITSGGVHDYPAITFAESERQKSKNLFKLNFWNKSNNIYQTNGITFTYNPNDYSITINGTATSRALCYLNPDALSNIKIGTYTFSGFNKKTDYSVYIQAFNEADGKYPALLYSDSDFRTVTFNIMPNFTDLYIAVDAGIVVDNLVLKLQAEEGSVATDYVPYYGQISHSGDKEIEFAEKEYQKSKNLIPYPYHDGNSIVSNGITFTVNNDQSISVSGTIIDHNINAVMWLAWDMPLKAGTYRISDSNSSNDLSVVAWIGNDYYQKDVNNGIFTLSSDTTAKIYIQVAKDSTKTYNDTVRFMLCEGIDTDWQPYNGAIVHDKDIADVEHIETIYDMSSNDSNINWGYKGGINNSNGTAIEKNLSTKLENSKGVITTFVFYEWMKSVYCRQPYNTNTYCIECGFGRTSIYNDVTVSMTVKVGNNGLDTINNYAISNGETQINTSHALEIKIAKIEVIK